MEGVRERVVNVNVLTVHDIKIGGIKNLMRLKQNKLLHGYIKITRN